jgi:hypothetical protein
MFVYQPNVTRLSRITMHKTLKKGLEFSILSIFKESHFLNSSFYLILKLMDK